MTLTNAIRTAADTVVPITVADARQLPNMLGFIVPAMLEAHGFYTARVGGAKTLYVKMPDHATRKALRDATLAVGRDAS